MSGPPSETKQAMRTQAEVSAGELDIMRTQQTQSAEDTARRKELQEPLIQKQQTLATGDPKAATAAMAPVLSQISGGYTSAKEQIMSSMAPGAARDLALANLEREKSTTIGTKKAEAVQAAPEILANVGSGLGAFALSEIGASLRAGEGASTSSKMMADSANQAKATQLGFLSSLAQTAGGAVGGSKWIKG